MTSPYAGHPVAQWAQITIISKGSVNNTLPVGEILRAFFFNKIQTFLKNLTNN